MVTLKEYLVLSQLHIMILMLYMKWVKQLEYYLMMRNLV